MYGITKVALAAASIVAPLVGATFQSTDLVERQAGGSWWLQTVPGKGSVPGKIDYKVFRNVRDFGARGDGVTDDSEAINTAISQGGRCGLGCNSSTTTPALIYFPSGTYLVKKPIIQFYFTQLVGDAVRPPTIKADPSLKAMGVIDSDPYDSSGSNYFTNQNNFFRAIRNMIIDLRGSDPTIAGIHWQVAQATSLTNIQFKMDKGSQQLGVFMDNGSGGFMADLTFDGGLYGAFFGNQQFTTRNLKFTNCDTAIFMNWNWLWTLKSIDVDASCNTAVNMSVGGPTSQTVGSVIIQDSVISSKVGIVTAYSAASKASNGTLILDNVDFSKSSQAVHNTNDGSPNANLAGGSVIQSWIQGSTYTTGTQKSAAGTGQKFHQGPLTSPIKPASLLANGKFVEKSKPQYETVPVSNIISVRAKGAKGDGVTDDTAALQAILDSATPDQVIFFDHGHYLLTDTLKIHSAVSIVGEVWPVLLADGASFNDESNPKVVIQVGATGSTIDVQMSDLVISTNGPAKGAILMEWNTKGSGIAGSNGLWDVHWRIGGFTGSNLQSDKCSRAGKGQLQPVNPECFGAFLMFHMTVGSSGYFENVWWWVADHELDLVDGNQINIYSGRGVLIESAGPTWLYATASEHSQLYNYQFHNAANTYIGAIQTETAYMQGNQGPQADLAFKSNAKFSDPDFAECKAGDLTCKMTLGIRVVDSTGILVYGAGLYSFFNNYAQECLTSGGGTDNCQQNMVLVDECSSDVYFYGLSTKAAVNMLNIGNTPAILGADNPGTFCSTVAVAEIA